MNGGQLSTRGISRALLCLSEADCSSLLRPNISGHAQLFHSIQALRSLGIDAFAIAVEVVPGELLALVENLRQQGVSVDLLRSGPEAARFAQETDLVLVQNAAIWIAPAVLDEVIRAQTETIFSLAEDPAYADFERIDLNRRWAGIAVLDPSLIGDAVELPDGWSLDSFLLRKALQAGYPVAQSRPDRSPEAVAIHCRAANSATVIASAIRLPTATSGWLDLAVERLSDSAISRWNSTGWWQALAQWMPVAAAALAAISAGLAFSVASYWSGFVAIAGLAVRRRTNQANYRAGNLGGAGWLAVAVLLAALFVNLRGEVGGAEGLFLTISFGGLAINGAASRLPIAARLLSPLTLALILAIMAGAGYAVAALKLLIVLMIVVQLVPMRGKSELNAN